MWKRTLVLALATLALFGIQPPTITSAISESGITWQLIVISSEPACTQYHYYLTEKYNDISEQYLQLYQIENINYKPECMTAIKYFTEYEKPRDLDLIILVYDRDKGRAELHSHNTGGIYMHQGDELTRNHTIIICDCSNFKYSDPVWILSHELSHFVLNYLGYDLAVVEDEIHSLDSQYDYCIEVSFSEACSAVKTKVETDRGVWTVMAPYEAAIGKSPPSPKVERITFESPFQREMILEMTNWWIGGHISDEHYITSLQILSGQADVDVAKTFGIFAESPVMILSEPPTEEKTNFEQNNSLDTKENVIEMSPFVEDYPSELTEEDQKILLQWLETKAQSWSSNEIMNNEFIEELEYLVNSPKTNLYLSYLDSLTNEELIEKGIEFNEDGKFRNALSYFDRAIITSLDTQKVDIRAFLGKAIALNALGKYEESVVYLDSAFESDSENIEALKMKAFTLAQLDKLEEAKNYFELAKQLEMN